MGLKDTGVLGLLAALWGASFLFMRIAVPSFGPVVLIDLRVLIAGISLLVYAAAIQHRARLRAQWKSYLVLGAVNAAVPFSLIATAELTLPASVAAILNATTPLFTAIVAYAWIREPLTIRKLSGLVLGLVGVAVLVGGSFPQGSGRIGWAIAFSLGAALFYSVGGVYAARRFSGVSPLTLAIGQQLAAGILLAPLALRFFPHRWPGSDAWAAVASLALLSTAVGYVLYFRLIRRIGPVKTLGVTFLVPVFGTLWSWWFLHEHVSGNALVGLLIILVGVALVSNLPLGDSRIARRTDPR